jgi:hypothetical protein
LKLAEYTVESGTETEAYIARALPRLEVALEEAESLPVEKLEFIFIRDENLRRIVERDFQEIQRAYLVKCWKSVIILAGGAMEAILLDLLLGREDKAKSAKKAPRKNDIRSWDLSELIAVAVELESHFPHHGVPSRRSAPLQKLGPRWERTPEQAYSRATGG